MLEIDRLREILKKLSIKEIDYIRKNAFHVSKENEGYYSSKIVFEIIVNYPENEFVKIKEHYKDKINKVAIKKLLQRLTDKILDLLSNKELLTSNNIYDKKGLDVFNIRRKILYYDILAAYGVTNYALLILNQVISLAKKIESYDYLIIALEKKLIKMSLVKGEIPFKKIYNEIVYYSECNRVLKKCNYLIRAYSSSYEYRKQHFTNDSLTMAIDEIKVDLRNIKSKSVRISLYFLEGILYSNNEQYLKLKRNFVEFYKYMLLNRNVVFNSYLITCLINISKIDTLLWSFDESNKSLKKIIKIFSRNEFNEKLLAEMIFLNYYFSGDIPNAEMQIKIVLSMKYEEQISSFLVSKRYFYLANVFSIQGLFKESNSIINKCQELDKDKVGWNIGLRILTIINNIELKKYIFVETLIENLRKHIARIKVEGGLTQRFSTISKVLIYLANNNFEFQAVIDKHKKLLDSLQSQNSSMHWILNSPEMIIFHEWFEAKAKGLAYNHAEVMKGLRRNYKRS